MRYCSCFSYYCTVSRPQPPPPRVSGCHTGTAAISRDLPRALYICRHRSSMPKKKNPQKKPKKIQPQPLPSASTYHSQGELSREGVSQRFCGCRSMTTNPVKRECALRGTQKNSIRVTAGGGSSRYRLGIVLESRDHDDVVRSNALGGGGWLRLPILCFRKTQASLD